MIRTAITDLFNIKYPIIQGGLQGLGTSELVGSVSEAGALGLITAGSYRNKFEMKRDIENVRNKTDNPFGVNIAIGIRRPMDEFVEGVIEAGVPIVFTSGNNPQKYMSKFKENHITVVHVAPNLRFAKKAEEIGCDAVVINGYEGGGHPGPEDHSSLILLQEIVPKLSIPVIAAGGFATGKSLLAALSLGASAIQMGTRFLFSEESILHPVIKEELLHVDISDTTIVKKSIKKHNRVWSTDNAQRLQVIESNGGTLEDILPFINGETYKELIYKGNKNSGIMSLGQSVGLVQKIEPVKQIVDSIVEVCEKQLERLNQTSSEKGLN
ncbi:nitronate monooxygenase [Halalkalibacillus sediminis]|uniref:Probable nitronate monooxygenase n=1 Tax=Halalkalibacillus sediminis TaxID=2018042 RepID=A0A2I0QU66_9BACI|nr:nitronate monooxygenase [Halalkalibacillus sediminis]PKR77895.1 nitronate monooxygenase [Halalkalibacillus sediminis]